MAEKQTNKDRMREIVDSIENGIKELFESDKYRKYLATMSRFHRYSVNNTMLIYMQRPDATHVAGFNKWRDQFGRNVLKGEKGIRIIAPTPYLHLSDGGDRADHSDPGVHHAALHKIRTQHLCSRRQ